MAGCQAINKMTTEFYSRKIYNFILFIYLHLWLCWIFAAVPGRSLVVASRAYSLVAVRGLLITVDSLAAEYRASVVVVHRLSCPCSTWDRLRSGIELFPELQG